MNPSLRLLTDTLEPLSDAELLSVALGLQGENAKPRAEAMLLHHGGLRGLALAPPGSLSQPGGISPAAGARLFAAMELTRRSLVTFPTTLDTVSDPEDAAALLVPALQNAGSEEVHALYLDPRGRVLERTRIGVGSERYAILDPGQILRRGLLLRASALILAHNHPSGDPEPSDPDLRATRRIAELAQPLGLRLLDHLIVGRPRWTSLARRDLIPMAFPEGEPLYLTRPRADLSAAGR
jgi:DNA repair protein RadC